MKQFSIILLLSVLLACGVANGAKKDGFGPGKQDWGHVTVRKGAHMFYWLYYTTATPLHTKRPLAIWLQGGPGASSTGYGNFEELGPLTLELNKRDTSWVKDMNVMFIDNPVGAGFSYVDGFSYYTRNNSQIALDLVEFMKQFYKDHPEFKTVPLHIFSESYGGKMAPEFALELHRAIQRREIESNLISVNLGDPWVSPVDSVNAWAPLLLNMGIVDHDGHDRIMESAKKTEDNVNNNKFSAATNSWGATQRILLTESKGVDFYDILKPVKGPNKARFYLSDLEMMKRTLVDFDLDEDRDKKLQELMRGPVALALNVSSKHKWGAQSALTFQMLNADFMKDVKDVVETLLNSTTIKVSVFSGQLDLICATPGTVKWINDLSFDGKDQYEAAPRDGITVNRVLEGYEKTNGNFSMFWVNRAGHMVPADNPAAMSHILNTMTGYPKDVK